MTPVIWPFGDREGSFGRRHGSRRHDTAGHRPMCQPLVPASTHRVRKCTNRFSPRGREISAQPLPLRRAPARLGLPGRSAAFGRGGPGTRCTDAPAAGQTPPPGRTRPTRHPARPPDPAAAPGNRRARRWRRAGDTAPPGPPGHRTGADQKARTGQERRSVAAAIRADRRAEEDPTATSPHGQEPLDESTPAPPRPLKTRRPPAPC